MSDAIELVGPLSTAVESVMNRLGAGIGLPPLFWSLRRDGQLAGFPGDDGVEIAERWAAELGLAGPTDELGGFRSWTGTVSTFRIEVFVRTADDDHL